MLSSRNVHSSNFGRRKKRYVVDEADSENASSFLNAYISDQAYKPPSERRFDRGWTVDKDLSDERRIVTLNPDGQVYVGFRGTANVQDIGHDVIAGLDFDRSVNLIRGDDRFMNLLLNKYDAANVNLTGHSLGGMLAINMGDKYNIPVTAFNPLINMRIARQGLSDRITGRKRKRKIYRTSLDPASILGAFNPNVKTVKRKRHLNPHTIHQFLRTD